MTTPPRGFDTAEFATRCALAQAAMAQADVGALLLTSEAEIRYFTGFMTQFWQSPTRPWFIVLPSSGKPVAVIPSIGAPLMRHCYIDDAISWASPAADDDGITLVADAIRRDRLFEQLRRLVVAVASAREGGLRDLVQLLEQLEDLLLALHSGA